MFGVLFWSDVQDGQLELGMRKEWGNVRGVHGQQKLPGGKVHVSVLEGPGVGLDVAEPASGSSGLLGSEAVLFRPGRRRLASAHRQ